MGKFNNSGARGGSTLSSRFATIATKPAAGKKKGQSSQQARGGGQPGAAPKKGPRARAGKQQADKGNKDGGKRENKKPASKDDLDMDMDKYWFAAGKGPNPEVAALDKDLDAYLENKGADPAAATEPPVAASGEPVA
mmetsp:Transcript_107754/g.232007  ORF Transcript_107754/g.232007 Transcript_107754/m.232007 type:complete len:137 (+) Transcript_107754:31-441(+)